jgi:hypothetical protein
MPTVVISFAVLCWVIMPEGAPIVIVDFLTLALEIQTGSDDLGAQVAVA